MEQGREKGWPEALALVVVHGDVPGGRTGMVDSTRCASAVHGARQGSYDERGVHAMRGRGFRQETPSVGTTLQAVRGHANSCGGGSGPGWQKADRRDHSEIFDTHDHDAAKVRNMRADPASSEAVGADRLLCEYRSSYSVPECGETV